MSYLNAEQLVECKSQVEVSDKEQMVLVALDKALADRETRDPRPHLVRTEAGVRVHDMFPFIPVRIMNAEHIRWTLQSLADRGFVRMTHARGGWNQRWTLIEKFAV